MRVFDQHSQTALQYLRIAFVLQLLESVEKLARPPVHLVQPEGEESRAAERGRLSIAPSDALFEGCDVDDPCATERSSEPLPVISVPLSLSSSSSYHNNAHLW